MAGFLQPGSACLRRLGFPDRRSHLHRPDRRLEYRPHPNPGSRTRCRVRHPPARELPRSACRHPTSAYSRPRYRRTRRDHRHPTPGANPGNPSRPHPRISRNTNPAGKFRGRVKKDFTNLREFVIIDKHSKSDPVAQLEERYLDMVEVVGSSPIGITIH